MRGHGYSDLLSYYSNFAAPRDTRADYAQGECDGAENKPRSDEKQLSGYELDIVNQARADISRFRLHMQADFGGSQGAVAARVQQRFEEYESELRDLGNRRDTLVASAHRELGESSGFAKQIDDELFVVEQSYGDLVREVDRQPERHFVQPVPLLSISTYSLLLVLVSFVELFINKGVFRTVLEGVASGYAGAMIMGLAIVFFSHVLGIIVRQWKVRRRPVEHLRVWLGIPLIIAIVCYSLVELSVIREATLPAEERMVSGTGIIGLSHEATLLLLLNLGVFFAGTLLSYYRHDPHPDFETLIRNVEKVRAEESRCNSRLQMELGLAEEEYRRKRSNLASRADHVKRNMDEDRVRSETLPFRERAEIEKVVAVVTQRVLAYQSGNERTRTAARPRYFGTLTVEMVEDLIHGRSSGARRRYVPDEEEYMTSAEMA